MIFTRLNKQMTWLEEPIYRKYAAKDSITKTLRGEVGLKKIELN